MQIQRTTKAITNGGVQSNIVVWFSKCVWCRGTMTRFEVPPLVIAKRCAQFLQKRDMLRKVAIIVAITTLIKVIVTSCCPDSLLDHTAITNLNWAATDLSEELNDGDHVSSPNLRLKLSIDVEFVTQNRFFHQPNTLLATSCENMGLDGLRNDISKITITSDRDILGTQAGDALNVDNKIMVYEDHFFDDAKNERISIDEWSRILNEGRRQQSRHEWYFDFVEPVEIGDFARFKIILEFADQTITQLETANIKIN